MIRILKLILNHIRGKGGIVTRYCTPDTMEQWNIDNIKGYQTTLYGGEIVISLKRSDY